jgi:hypothetical protein
LWKPHDQERARLLARRIGAGVSARSTTKKELLGIALNIAKPASHPL